MRLNCLSIGLATALLLSASPATASEPLLDLPGDGNELVMCIADQTAGETPAYACPAVAQFETSEGTFYVTYLGVYKETNGCAGLQTLPSDCDGDGATDEVDDFQSLGDLSGQDLSPTRPAFAAGERVLVEVATWSEFLFCEAQDLFDDADTECIEPSVPLVGLYPSDAIHAGFDAVDGGIDDAQCAVATVYGPSMGRPDGCETSSL